MTECSCVRVNTKEGWPPRPWAGIILGVYKKGATWVAGLNGPLWTT
jgi:hypothetical protein